MMERRDKIAAGAVEAAAVAAWAACSLAARYNPALSEPLPPEWLALLGD